MTSWMFAGETPDALLDELTDLASTAPSSDVFFAAILKTAIPSTNAKAGAIWSAVGANFRLEQEVGLVPLGIGADIGLQAIHEDALELATKGPKIVASDSSRAYAGHEYRFYGCRDGDQSFLVFELVHEIDSIGEVEQGAIASFMSALSEIARDFRNTQTLRRLQSEEGLWRDLQSILPPLYASSQLEELGYVVANEGRAFIGCDRLTLARVNRAQVTILATSGVATIDKRARHVRELEQLVSVVAKGGQSIRYPLDQVELPQLIDSLSNYLDATRCEQVWVVLITHAPSANEPRDDSDDRQCIGALVIEEFSVKDIQALSRRCDLFLDHLSIAFRKADELDCMPLRRLSLSLERWAGFYRDYRIRLLAGVVAAVSAVLLALVIRVDLNIDASGSIQPANNRHLYAPANGEVERIHVSHQSKVKKGDLLLEIRSRDLELRKEELVTLRSSSLERLRSIEVARLQNRKTESSESLDSHDLSATEVELREVVASQSEQLSILDDMLNALKIESPVDGQVISWDPGETLEYRPVQQGQKLLSVAALDGDKKLQLRVRDEDARHVMEAFANDPGGVRVTFTVASDPGVKHTATVTQIGTAVETVSSDGPTLRVDASVDRAAILNVRPGATVYARIHCGKSSIGYAWTRRLIDYMSLRLF